MMWRKEKDKMTDPPPGHDFMEDEVQFENRQHIPKVVAGLDLVVEEVQDILQGNARVGMFGVGGVGKTTIAMAMFNKLCPRFEYSCFVPEVKKQLGPEKWEGDYKLKKEMWKRLHWRGKKVADPDFDWYCHPNTENWSQLRGKKLLLVLDDVAEDHHLKVLLDIAEDIAPESCVIVTSRNVELFTSFEEDIYEYPVQLLNRKNAKELFMSYAFPHHAVLPVALERIVDLIVEKCGGLPLTLKVLGKYLKRKKEEHEIWEQTLEALDKADDVAGLDERLWAKLRLSYTGLNTEEQQMFLDASTIFSDGSGWTLRDAKAAWSVVYGEYVSVWWQTLVDMSLVYPSKDDDEPIKVPEQLQSMGRKIASEANKDGKCMRIWKPAEGLELLGSTTDKSTHQEILSLRLVLPKLVHVNIPRSFLPSLKKLHFLDISIIREPDKNSGWKKKPPELETLQGDLGLVLLRTPSMQFGQALFDPTLLPRLAVLELMEDERDYLPRSIGQLSNLKIFRIEWGLSTLSDEIGNLSKLERLILKDILGKLKLPETFGRLSNLNHLEIHRCPQLESVPESFGLLSALQRLEFHSCESLYELPQSFRHLCALSYLEFDKCRRFRFLPGSFWQLSALKHLHFKNCRNLRGVPESFGRLPGLQYLKFRECNQLRGLPESFGLLSVLEHLKFDKCDKLQTLPNSFGQLRRLEHLEFVSCGDLQTLPETFGQLSALKHLAFCMCEKLRTLPDSFGQLGSLTHLEFLGCGHLQTRPDSFGQLESLEKLIIFDCRKIERLLFDPGQLKALHFLAIDCVALSSIPECIKSLLSLQIVEVGFLPYLEEWPPWLGGMRSAPWLGETLLDLSKFSWKFCRAQDGNFAFIMEEDDILDWKDLSWRRKFLFKRELQLHTWLHAYAMDKVSALDYVSAIVGLQVALKYLHPDCQKFQRRFILQEMGIIKRYTGDLRGALEDLTVALEDTVQFEGFGHDMERLGYDCRKHRGYVKYLLGDEEGAREDAQEALLQLKSRRYPHADVKDMVLRPTEKCSMFSERTWPYELGSPEDDERVRFYERIRFSGRTLSMAEETGQPGSPEDEPVKFGRTLSMAGETGQLGRVRFGRTLAMAEETGQPGSPEDEPVRFGRTLSMAGETGQLGRVRFGRTLAMADETGQPGSPEDEPLRIGRTLTMAEETGQRRRWRVNYGLEDESIDDLEDVSIHDEDLTNYCQDSWVMAELGSSEWNSIFELRQLESPEDESIHGMEMGQLGILGDESIYYLEFRLLASKNMAFEIRRR